MKTNEESTQMYDGFGAAAKSEEGIVSEKENPVEGVVEETNEETMPENRQENSGWKRVVIGGVSGIVLGATGIVFSASQLPDPQPGPGPEPNPVPDPTPTPTLQHAEINFASGVNDGMSFSEAFATARHEVGAGGAFVWHGHVYGTYYGNEWNQMTPEEQGQFTADAVSASHGIHTPTPPTPDPDPVEVHVLGVETDVVLGDGIVADVGFADIGGHIATFIDVDPELHDGFDIVGIDENDNGKIDENEIAPLSPGSGLSVETFQQELGAQVNTDPADQIYSQTPDYVNDADVSGYNA